MNTRFLLIIFMLCNILLAKGQVRIELTEQNREVCPRQGGNYLFFEYRATIPDTICNRLNWEFTRTAYDHLPHWFNTTTTNNHSVHGIVWSVPTATLNATTGVWSLPRGTIRVINACDTTQRAQENITLLSVRGLQVPRLNFRGASGTSLQHGDELREPYNSTAPFPVTLPQLLTYLNTTHRVYGYEWSIPTGWTASWRGVTQSDTIFQTYSRYIQEHVILVTPNACSGGQIRIRPVDFRCHNQNVDSLKGAWMTVNVVRTRPSPSIFTPSPVSWGVETTVDLNAIGASTAESFEWLVSGNFTQTGLIPTEGRNLRLTHRGCSEGWVRVRAIYCGGYSVWSNEVTVSVNQPTGVSIQGNSILNATNQQYFVQNFPAGSTASWTLGPHIQRGTSSGNNILLSPNVAQGRCESSWIRASISRNGCTFQLPQRNIHVGFAPNPSLISSQSNHTTVGNTEFIDIITYRGLAVRANNSHGIATAEWQQIPGGGVTITRFFGDHPVDGNSFVYGARAGLTASLPGANTIRARLQNQCGTSNWANISYTRPSPGGPIFGSCPCNCTCCYVSPCHQCGGFDNCPFCPCFSSGGFLAFPNPVDNILTINLTQVETPEIWTGTSTSSATIRASEVFYIRLFNAHGMIVRQQRTQARTIQFDVSNLPEGTYYLHIEHNGEIEKHQIIVQRN